MIPPGLCIAFLALVFYLIGIGTEQVINPRLRKSQQQQHFRSNWRVGVLLLYSPGKLNPSRPNT